MTVRKNDLWEPPTKEDLERLGDDLVRRVGKTKAYAWCCEVPGCRNFASGMSKKGRKICSRHGGSTYNKRNKAAVQKAADKAKKEGKPIPKKYRPAAGRPVKTGFYSADTAKVDEIVRAYREANLDPDATDDDMYYLRAYLDELKNAREPITELLKRLEDVQGATEALLSIELENRDGMTYEEALEETGALRAYMNGVVKPTQVLVRSLTKLIDSVETRHARLIGLAKTRADTRLKNSAARQLDVFLLMLKRLSLIMEETLPSHHKAAMEARFSKDFAEIPRALLESNQQLDHEKIRIEKAKK